jgi:hypothetical protein
LDVLHDKRSMERLLAVVKLVNAELHRILQYILTQGTFCSLVTVATTSREGLNSR